MEEKQDKNIKSTKKTKSSIKVEEKNIIKTKKKKKIIVREARNEIRKRKRTTKWKEVKGVDRTV